MNATKKNWNLLALALIASLSFAGYVQAEEKAQEKETLADHMGVINSAVKKLRKNVKNADMNKDSIELSNGAAVAAAACLAMTPEIAKKVPAADKDKFIAEYKKQMGELIDSFKSLSKLLMENKNDDAEAIVTKLLDQKKKGHEQFTE